MKENKDRVSWEKSLNTVLDGILAKYQNTVANACLLVQMLPLAN